MGNEEIHNNFDANKEKMDEPNDKDSQIDEKRTQLDQPLSQDHRSRPGEGEEKEQLKLPAIGRAKKQEDLPSLKNPAEKIKLPQVGSEQEDRPKSQQAAVKLSPIKQKTATLEEHQKKGPEDMKPALQGDISKEQSSVEVVKEQPEPAQEIPDEKSQTKQIQQEQQKTQELPVVIMSNELQVITCFNPQTKSPTILLQDMGNTGAFQSELYYQNSKVILTHPITSLLSECTFRLDNLKYCLGVGVAFKEIIEKHEYTYKSDSPNELYHGLYIVTSQGYSWSHSEKHEDDVLRAGFNQLYSGVEIKVRLEGEQLSFKWKKGEFTMHVPSDLRNKYTLCYCAYLHEKSDAVSISS